MRIVKDGSPHMTVPQILGGSRYLLFSLLVHPYHVVVAYRAQNGCQSFSHLIQVLGRRKGSVPPMSSLHLNEFSPRSPIQKLPLISYWPELSHMENTKLNMLPEYIAISPKTQCFVLRKKERGVVVRQLEVFATLSVYINKCKQLLPLFPFCVEFLFFFTVNSHLFSI